MLSASEGSIAPPQGSLLAVVRAVVASPRAWFSWGADEGAGRAVRVALIVHLLADPIAELTNGLAMPQQRSSVLAALVAGPVRALATIYLSSGVVYALARGRAHFATITQCFAYAQVAALASIIPVVGPLAVLPWYLTLAAMGLRYRAGRSWSFAAAGAAATPVLAVGIALCLRTYFVEAFRIPSPGMAPTLLPGDHFFVRKGVYGQAERRLPQRGDVIVFRFPERPAEDFAQRAIGMPGDTVAIRKDEVEINGLKIPSCVAGRVTLEAGDKRHTGDLVVEFLEDRSYLVFRDDAHADDEPEERTYRVAPGEVFTLGDNRQNSNDSRLWRQGRGGGVPLDLIKGRAGLVWMSISSRIDWTRTGSNVNEAPRCQTPLSPEACAGLERCLANRPPPAATTPPAAGTKP